MVQVTEMVVTIDSTELEEKLKKHFFEMSLQKRRQGDDNIKNIHEYKVIHPL